MSSTWYCSREEVKASLDIKETARANAQVDRLIAASTDSVDSDMNRTFAPVLGTRTFDWPDENTRGTRPWRLWLNQNELISLTSASSGGITIPVQNVLLRPDWGPPHSHIELDRDSVYGFGGGSNPQRAISFGGLWGFRDDAAAAGALAAAVASTTATTVTVSNAALTDVGHVLRIDSERMAVTGRASVDTGTTLVGALAASAASTSVPVMSVAAVNTGEMITLDSERMMVDDIAGNSLVVRRAVDGSALATHTNGAKVYAQRLLTVERGVLGTTAATHSNAAPITRLRFPDLVNQLTRAYTLVGIQDEAAGYARVIGAESSRTVLGQGGITELRDRAVAAYGRKNRHRAV